MLGLIFILVIGMSIVGVFAITINDEIAIIPLMIALAMAIFLGMQIEKYKQSEAEKYEQIYKEQNQKISGENE